MKVRDRSQIPAKRSVAADTLTAMASKPAEVRQRAKGASKKSTIASAEDIRSGAAPVARKLSSLPKYCQKSQLRREQLLQAIIGQEVRATRTKHGMTVVDLAGAADISIGMLSKIENGMISPSLKTLQSLSSALGLPLTSFFRHYDCRSAAVFVKVGQGTSVRRNGVRPGDECNLLGFGGAAAGGIVVKPYLITLNEAADEFPVFHHYGMEFLYMLEGEVVYGHGTDRYRLSAGDSLFFDGDTPHGPDEVTKLPVRLLSIISYSSDARKRSA